jgi:peptide/nickel transport system substrate-binding protein
MVLRAYGMVLRSLAEAELGAAMREKEALTGRRSRNRSAPARCIFAKIMGPGQQGGLSRTRTTLRARRGAPPPSFGSKIGVDRIELVWISDPGRDVGAGQRRDRFLREPQHRPAAAAKAGVKLMKTGQIDSTQGMIRLNHLHPPFNNVKARQAMYHLINQEDFLRAIIGDPKYYRVCHGLLTCGAPRRRQPAASSSIIPRRPCSS